MELAITALIVSLGSGVGGALRYLLGVWVVSYNESIGVYGTYVVNVLGSFGLASLMVYREMVPVHPSLLAMLGAGFFGGFTTYSTYNYETFMLLSKGDWGPGMAYLSGTLVSGLLGAWLGAQFVTRWVVG